LFGTIGIAVAGAGFEDLVKIRPLSKVSIHATGNRGTAFSTLTDDQGAYAFSSLPDDTYRIEQDLEYLAKPVGRAFVDSKRYFFASSQTILSTSRHRVRLRTP
jgi:hypothetical protein